MMDMVSYGVGVLVGAILCIVVVWVYFNLKIHKIEKEIKKIEGCD